jgi:hypothetical protein
MCRTCGFGRAPVTSQFFLGSRRGGTAFNPDSAPLSDCDPSSSGDSSLLEIRLVICSGGPPGSRTGMDSITTLRRPGSPAFAVDDLVERTPTRMRDRQEGTVSRVPERHEPDAEAILGEVEDLARQRLVVNSRM